MEYQINFEKIGKVSFNIPKVRNNERTNIRGLKSIKINIFCMENFWEFHFVSSLHLVNPEKSELILKIVSNNFGLIIKNGIEKNIK